MIAAYFQDLNPQDTKLTIKNNQLLEDFKNHFGTKISQWVKTDPSTFLQEIYAPLLAQSSKELEVAALLQTMLKESDLSNLKEALYRLDFWLNYETLH